MDHAPGAGLVTASMGARGPTGIPKDTNGRPRRWRRLAHLGGQELQLRAGAVLVGILALATGLRFVLLAKNSVWLDEVFVVWVAQHPWRDIPGLLRVVDQHPPLYFVFMHMWTGVAGTSEVAIRFPSACFSLCSVVLTYVLARRISTEAVSLLSAFLVALSPFQIMSGQEARMYPLMGAMALASTVVLLSSVDRGGVVRWAIYVIASAAMAYTHYFGVLVLLAHGVWIGCWERRHLRTWIACTAVAAALYAPWIPSVLDQTRHVHSFAWYHNPASYMNVNDLLGLSAFGGSLFGTASYFFTGTVGPAEQFVVLLPFLVLLWRGVVAFAGDRRSLALLGLPPLVTIGVMWCFSLTRPMFVPRWFSFLVPFLAIALARGVYDLAEHLDLRRARVVPVLISVLLLYQTPVLDRYYGDRGFRPFQWRAAARLVRELVRPGDAFVFVGSSAALPFRYYFREPYPSLEVTPEDRVTLTDGQVQQLAAQHPRLWLVATIPFTAETRDRLLGGLGHEYRVAGVRDFSGALIYLLSERRSPR